MIPLAETQLPVGLIEEPVPKPNTPFEGVVKCRFGRAWFAQPNPKGGLQRGAETLDLQLRRDLTILPSNVLTFQGDYSRPFEKN